MLKKLLVLLLIALMTICMISCGGGDTSSDETTEPAATDAEESTEVQEEPATQEPAEEEPVAEEPQEEPEPEITQVKVGDSYETDSFKMVVDSVKIVDEYKFSPSEYASFDLYVEEGYKLLLVQGTIENTGSTVISDYSFTKTAVVNGDYTVDGSDVRLCFERDKNFELDPYTEQKFDLYINIPEKLADQYETSTFTMGYKDDFSTINTKHEVDGTVSTDATNWFEITD